MLVCVFLCAILHTRPRVQRAPGLPCALYFFGGSEVDANLGLLMPREYGLTSCSYLKMESEVSHRHCEPTGRANARPMTGSAKQSISPREERMDCFAALAMTARGAGRRNQSPQNDPRRRVVAGAFLAANLAVDAGFHQARRQHGAEQEMIEPQAGIARPAVALVVPECEHRL